MSEGKVNMSENNTSTSVASAAGRYRIRPLAPDTWDAFVALCDHNNGAGMGGCWCTWFHNATSKQRRACTGGDDDQAREYKHGLVEAGRAHAALVFDGDAAVGWCEYGSPEELPGIAHRKDVEQPGEPVPDFRITCFYVDRRHRRRGVATAALDGALRQIAHAGGGLVESYPQDTPDRKVSSSFLYNATRGLFERAGFDYVRPKGKNHCIVRREVTAA